MQALNGPNWICLKLAVFQLYIFIAFFIFSVTAGPRYSSRIVETKTGAIRGVILELNSKHLEPVEVNDYKKIFFKYLVIYIFSQVFKAVPYAAPPVDSLRFEAPKKLPSWKGTKLADTFGPVCPQVF